MGEGERGRGGDWERGRGGDWETGRGGEIIDVYFHDHAITLSLPTLSQLN